MPSSVTPVRPHRPHRRRVRVSRPAPPAVAFAAELLRLFDEGHRCFCPDCRARAREHELRRRRCEPAAPPSP